MKKDNRGFSLIELVAVIAIMLILIGTMAANVARISGYRAKECRTKVVSSLENGRLQTLSKSRGGTTTADAQTYLSFIKNTADGCNYYFLVVDSNVKDVKKISKSRVTLKVAYSEDAVSSGASAIVERDAGIKNISTNSSPTVLADMAANGTRVAYDRQSGAFLKNSSDAYIYRFFAESGNYSYGITLHPKTGKVEVGERTRISRTS